MGVCVICGGEFPVAELCFGPLTRAGWDGEAGYECGPCRAGWWTR